MSLEHVGSGAEKPVWYLMLASYWKMRCLLMAECLCGEASHCAAWYRTVPVSLGLLELAPPSRMLITSMQERKCTNLICGKKPQEGRFAWVKVVGHVLCSCTVPSETPSEDGVGTSTLPWAWARAGSAALTVLCISRQDLACTKQVWAWDWWTCACLCRHAHRVWGDVKYRSSYMHLRASWIRCPLRRRA